MPRKGTKAEITSPFNYDDMRDDHPSFEYLQVGLSLNESQMSDLRKTIRDEMQSRGMMGAQQLNTKHFNDSNTGLVPILVTFIKQQLKPITDLTSPPEPWVEYAITCIIHIERHNRVRQASWREAYQSDSKRRSRSRGSDSEASTTTTKSSGKRKRESTEPTDIGEEDKEPSTKLQALSVDDVIWISCYRQDGQEEPFDFDIHEICTRDIGGRANVGFMTADYDQYLAILTGEKMIKDTAEELFGYFPNTLTWRKIVTEFTFRSSLTQQYQNDRRSPLRFEVRRVETGISNLLFRSK